MEPILQHPFFPSLLRVWRFVTTFHDYLDLPELFSNVSLYEFDQHVKSQKYLTAFTAQLLEALVKKASGNEKSKKNQSTCLFLAKENKFKILPNLLKTSAYQLGLTEVSFALAWRNLPLLSSFQGFQQLPLKEKYSYLSILADLISASSPFKKTYMESIKTEYSEATKVQGRVLLDVQKKYVPKMSSHIVLGITSDKKCYFYVSKIGDSILECESQSKKWRVIKGQDAIRQQIVENLLKKQSSIVSEQIDLLEHIADIWHRIGWTNTYLAFDKDKKLFDIKEQSPKLDKLAILKQKLHSLDYEYTKFVSNCFNFRWAPKQRRIEFHKAIDEAKDSTDLVTVFSKFFHETRHHIQKKSDTLDFYDPSLDTPDAKPEEFRNAFLHANYMYSKGVIAESHHSQKFTVSLYHHIKSFLQNSDNFQPFFFQYLMVFIESMLGIIAQMYPKAYEKRLVYIEKLQEEIRSKKLQEEQLNKKGKHKNSRLNKATHRTNYQQNSDNSLSESQEQSQSETTVEKHPNSKNMQGRRLRQKIKINYNYRNSGNSVSNSKSKSKTRKSKQNKTQSRGQPSRPAKKAGKKAKNTKNTRKGKMRIDSDSQNQSQNSVQLSVSQNSQQSGGLNLEKYKYEESSPRPLRRSVRNSSKSKE